ncbi:MAG: glycosyltransferase family A protein, partial [Parvibaculum sedimenti]
MNNALPEAGEHPTISVVIPYYNSGAFIEGALEQLSQQTFRDFEVVIVDDGSSADEAALAREAAARWHAIYLRQSNAGPGAARNRGARMAKGTWIAFLDVDDTWEPSKLAEQIAAGADQDLVLCDTQTVAKSGTLRHRHFWSSYIGTDVFSAAILRGDVYSFTSAIFVRTELFFALGGFDERLRYLEDHHFLYRAVKVLRWTCLGKALSSRIVHEESMSHISRNLDVDAHVERRKLFLDVLSEFEPELDKKDHLLREMHRNIKRSIVMRRPQKALELALRAVALK